MKLSARAVMKTGIAASAVIKTRVVATARIKSLQPANLCPTYDMIDGGTPGTTYTPINSFDLIDGGTP